MSQRTSLQLAAEMSAGRARRILDAVDAGERDNSQWLRATFGLTEKETRVAAKISLCMASEKGNTTMYWWLRTTFDITEEDPCA